MKQLFTPLLYLKIQNPVKRHFDLKIPLAVSSIITVLFFFANRDLSVVLTDGGVLTSIKRLLQILAGFFIASLAAIATFSNESIDKPLSGEPAKLYHHKYKNEPEILTRRRFLTFLFGYLSFSSIMIYLALSSIKVFDLALNKIFSLGQNQALILSWIIFAGFCFWFFNIIITTLLGLHYLTERIHRPEQNPRIE